MPYARSVPPFLRATMILTEPDEKTPSSSSNAYLHAPSSSYALSSSYASTPAPSSSGRSDTLQPPTTWTTWQQSASEPALPLPLPPPSFPPPSRAASENPHPQGLRPPTQPAALSRPPPPDLPRTAFQPMYLLADANSLRAGFPVVLPPSPRTPHPFAVHDVCEADWKQFLDDMRTLAHLSPQETATAYGVPILSALPLINVAVASAITHHIKRKKPRLVSLLVDKWNHHFFHPRGMEVILMRGQTKLSGQSDQPVAQLYTPRTVSFTPPPVDVALKPRASFSGTDAPSLSGTDSPDASPEGVATHKSKAQAKAERHARDKTWRLFVVSMEA
ncbi:hypothetical protein B0H15DRAFT_947157 [Mycena belliarum]|uniref:Uncharacterized protein n=1 Tax=Mycena belliarum TaxID=1033014 RepID=A0AAD6UD94_9AGAR|nr:hypothetical protein B0H15DRAFT_947157 [Mycena belliae]